MKITVSQEALVEALSTVSGVVPSKSTLPILTNVLVQADRPDVLSARGVLTLTANNLEMAITHRVEAEVETEGAITLPGRLLSDYVAELTHGQQVSLELNPKSMKVALEAGRYKANITGIDAEDFPPVPTVSGDKGFVVSAAVLKRALDGVIFCTASDDARPVLAGVLMKAEGTLLTLAAADGFRLGVIPVELTDDTSDVSVIVPGKTLAEIQKKLPEDDTLSVRVTCSDRGNQIHFSFGSTDVTSRLIDGQFPDYNRIIPPSGTTTVDMNTADLLKMTRAASVFAKDNSNIVRLEASPGSRDVDAVLVKSTSAEMGDMTGTMWCKSWGEPCKVAFNGRYLRDALQSVGTTQVRVELTGSATPGVLRPVADKADDRLWVIMPMDVKR